MKVCKILKFSSEIELYIYEIKYSPLNSAVYTMVQNIPKTQITSLVTLFI